jgi:hypothetical protein
MTRIVGPGPDPNQIYPMQSYDKLVFLKNFIKASNIHIGGGVANVWNKPHEEKYFYKGYRNTEINMAILAYYRHE